MGEISHLALGSWSGGRFLHYGVELGEDRLVALLRPESRIRTVLTADVYGQGEADRLVGRALAGLPREDFALVGAIGHDFTEGERDGPRGFPRFTDPSLRGAEDYGSYIRRATEASLERCGVDAFDLLLLHNPDRIGYTSEAVWEGMAAVRDAGLTRMIGVAPGPANGFTLDVIDCLERFGSEIDWAMVILNPLEPWPGALVLPACEANDVRVITRVVDYGGLFWDQLGAEDEGSLERSDHRSFRPPGWIAGGLERLDAMRPIAERHGLTMLQLACVWNLANPAVACAVPTLIQEAGDGARAIESQREELAATPAGPVLSEAEIAEIRALGDNTGCMALKGASPDFDGEERPDRWALSAELSELGARWGIEPELLTARR